MRYKLLLYITLFCLLPINVFAKEDIKVDCNKIDENYECKVSGNIDYAISAIDFHFSLPSNATIISYELDTRWEGSADNFWVSLYSAEDSKGEIPLLTFIISSDKKIVGEDFKIKDLLIYDSEYNEHRVEEKEEQSIKKDNNILLIFTICAIIIIACIIIVIWIIKWKGDSK